MAEEAAVAWVWRDSVHSGFFLFLSVPEVVVWVGEKGGRDETYERVGERER